MDDLILPENVMQIDAADGDVLLVTMPEHSLTMTDDQLRSYHKNVIDTFDNVFKDKKVRTVVVPFGMKVEIVKSSEFEDE